MGKTQPLIELSLFASLLLALFATPSATAISGVLYTPDLIVAENDWQPPPTGSGFRIEWEVMHNPDSTWKYAYWFYTQDSSILTPMVSHATFQISNTADATNLFGFAGDIDLIDTFEVRTFYPAKNSPGMPSDLYGVKVNFGGENQTHIEFNSDRQPMWADFYAKGGRDAFAYNIDFGTPVANANDYLHDPLDDSGTPLAKILSPDTDLPEPATLSLLLLGAAALLRRRP